MSQLAQHIIDIVDVMVSIWCDTVIQKAIISNMAYGVTVAPTTANCLLFKQKGCDKYWMFCFKVLP